MTGAVGTPVMAQVALFFRGGLGSFDLLSYLIWIVALTLAVTLHEVAHGYAAYRMGDPTAREAGRLTLNPLAHFDLFGALLILMRAPIAWAKPVPINTRRFDGRVTFKTAMIFVSLAGIATNIVTAWLAYVLNLILILIARSPDHALYEVLGGFRQFLMLFTQLSVWLAVFNLLPIPPLDGFKFLGQFMPFKVYQTLLKYERQIGLVFLFVLIFGRGILARILTFLAQPIFWLITTPVNAIFNWILTLS